MCVYLHGGSLLRETRKDLDDIGAGAGGDVAIRPIDDDAKIDSAAGCDPSGETGRDFHDRVEGSPLQMVFDLTHVGKLGSQHEIVASCQRLDHRAAGFGPVMVDHTEFQVLDVKSERQRANHQFGAIEIYDKKKYDRVAQDLPEFLDSQPGYTSPHQAILFRKRQAARRNTTAV